MEIMNVQIRNNKTLCKIHPILITSMLILITQIIKNKMEKVAYIVQQKISYETLDC
jgi:hypothetical protein